MHRRMLDRRLVFDGAALQSSAPDAAEEPSLSLRRFDGRDDSIRDGTERVSFEREHSKVPDGEVKRQRRDAVMTKRHDLELQQRLIQKNMRKHRKRVAVEVDFFQSAILKQKVKVKKP